MNTRDRDKVEYIVRGLLHDMPKSSGWGEGYHAGVRAMQNSIRLLVAGQGRTLDNIVGEVRKHGGRGNIQRMIRKTFRDDADREPPHDES